jgi:hypothetical protein
MTATFARRGASIPREPPAALSRRFAESPDKLAQWKGFLKRARVRIDTPPFSAVVKAVAEFALEPLDATRVETMFRRHWQPGGPWMGG